MPKNELQTLSLVHADQGCDPSRLEVTVEFRLERDTFVARYDAFGQAPCVDGSLSKKSSQWGLWEFDVAELFICARGPVTLPYYEFQVSPLDQFFELEIFEPRVRFNREFTSDFDHAAGATGAEAWWAELKIPLTKLGWDGQPQSLIGNAFAILGPKGHRSYWSLNTPKQDKPDFHRPEHFTAFFRR